MHVSTNNVQVLVAIMTFAIRHRNHNISISTEIKSFDSHNFFSTRFNHETVCVLHFEHTFNTDFTTGSSITYTSLHFVIRRRDGNVHCENISRLK